MISLFSSLSRYLRVPQGRRLRKPVGHTISGTMRQRTRLCLEILEHRDLPSGVSISVANAALDEVGQVDNFISSGSGGLQNPKDLIQGPDGNIYVTSSLTNSVIRYSPTGQPLGTFVTSASGGLGDPWGLAFGPDGNLYVTSRATAQGTNSIYRYNGTTGAFIDTFVTAGSGGLHDPIGITFGADGNLYVCSFVYPSGGTPGTVMRYEGPFGPSPGSPLPSAGQSGAVFVAFGSGGMIYPEVPIFGPDGNLYVSDAYASILRFDGTTGAFLNTYVGGLSASRGIAFDQDGRLYVADSGSNAIHRYDNKGNYLDDVVTSSASSLVFPTGLIFDSQGKLLVCSRDTNSVASYDRGVVVTLSAASATPVSVNYATIDDTATAPNNYTAQTGTVTFTRGQTSRLIPLVTIPDPSPHGNRTFNVQLANATGGATITAGNAVVTIIDPAAPVITTTTLPNGTVGQADYSQTISAVGGSGSFTFSSSGTLPRGLTLGPDGLLSGMPTTAGSFAFTVTATDTVGSWETKTYTIIVNPAVVITTTTLANWNVNQTGYSKTITAYGGTGPLTFSSTRTLPPGLTLNSAGVLAGTPTAKGSYTFTVWATDTVGASASQSYTIGIGLTFTTLTLPNWTVNQPGYNQILSATGATGSPAFTSSGTLPAGLILSPTGVLSGTPTAAGSFTFTLTATDTLGITGSQTYTVIINPAVAITTATLADWTINQAGYSQTLLSTGGTGNVTYSWTGSLPSGLTLSSSGILSGTPTAAGTYNFTVTASDAVGASGSISYTLLINPAVTITTTVLPTWTADLAYDQTIRASGGSGSLTFSATGTLPTGLILSSAGILAGLPIGSGSYTFSVTATDTVSAGVSSTFTVLVNPPVTLHPASLPADTVNLPYNQTIAAGGGTGDQTLVVSGISGAIPGLTVPTSGTNSLVISGTPTAAGSEKLTVTATDTLGASAAVTYTLTVNATSAFLSLPASGFSGGRNSTVLNYPIDISQLSDTATPKHVGLTSATLVLTYPTGVFGLPIGAGLATPYVNLGSVPLSDTAGARGSNDWTLTATSSADGKLTINLNAETGNSITSDTGGGTLVTINFPVLGTAPLGAQAITLVSNSGGHTQIVGSNGAYTLSPAPPYSGTITVVPPPLQVVVGSFSGTPSGFSLQFNQPILVNSITPVLYGQGFGATAPVPSVTLTQVKDASGTPVNNPIEGSLVLDQATNSITFVATNTALLADNGSPLLPDGTYKIDLTSSAATNGFQALGGGFLDGLASGTPGSGDYSTTFTVNAAAAGDDVVWIPPTADGPGQALSAPGNNQTGGGYPIYLSDTTGTVTSVQLTLTYNPALLTVTGVSGANFSLLASSTPGQAVLQYSGPALAAGAQTPIAFLLASVPAGTAANPTPYRAKDLLHLSGAVLNSGTVPVVTSDGLHVVAYVGDANGDGTYSSDDAAKIIRAELQIDSGFAAYPLVDPVIVADTDGAGFIPADAGLQISEAALGYPTATLSTPPIPSGVSFRPVPARAVASPSLPNSANLVPGTMQNLAPGTVQRPLEPWFQALDRGVVAAADLLQSDLLALLEEVAGRRGPRADRPPARYGLLRR